MKLWQITDELEQLFYNAENGEMAPDFHERLEALNIAFAEKLAACLAVLEDKKANIVKLKNAINRMTGLKRTTENEVDSLLEYMLNQMKRAGKRRIDVGTHRVTMVQSKRAKIVVHNVDSLARHEQSLTREEIKVHADKDAIREWFEATGEIPEGTEIITNPTHLRIS